MTIEMTDEVALGERRIALLRERLADLKPTLADRRAALLHAHAVAGLRPRFRLDALFLLGLILSPGLSLLVGLFVSWAW